MMNFNQPYKESLFALPSLFGKNAGIDTGVVISSQQFKKKLDKIYEYPASYKKALMHKNAYQFGYNSQKDNQVKVCVCCYLPINTVPIPLCYGTTPLKDKIKQGQSKFMLDSGSTMFFTFIKIIIVYLLLRVLIVDSYNIITNIISYAALANQQVFKTNLFSQFTIYSKLQSNKNNLIFVLDVLNLVAVVFSIVIFYFIRKYNMNLFQLVDSSNTTQGDYSIFVEKIPIILPTDKTSPLKALYNYEEQLKRVFEDKIREWKRNMNEANQNQLDEQQKKMKLFFSNVKIQDRIVSSVSLCFDLTQIQKIASLRTNVIEQYNKIKDDNENVKNGQIKQQMRKQIEDVNQQIIELCQRFGADNSKAFNLAHFVGKAFVSFQFEFYAQQIIKQSKLKKTPFIMFNRKLGIHEPAEPSDVYWYNMKITDEQRSKSVIFSYILLILCLIVSFACLYLLQTQQIKKTGGANNTQLTTKQLIFGYIFTITMATLISVINIVLGIAVELFTQSEKHMTKTLHNFSLIIKNTIVQFLNSAVIYFIICTSQKLQPLGPNGIVTKVTSLVTVTGIVNIALNFAQIGSTIKLILNKCKYRNSLDKPVQMFQFQLNKEIQKPQFAYSARYAYYITQIYIVSFYGYIAPYAVLIQACLFIVDYWVDKLNLFRRCSSPTDFGFKLTKLNLKMLEFSLLIFTIGNFIFGFMIHQSDVNKSFVIINSISLGIAFVYCVLTIFLPTKILYSADQVASIQLKSFTQCVNNNSFKRTYWQSNPGTSYTKQADVNHPGQYLKGVRQVKIAQQQDYEFLIGRAQSENPIIDKYEENDVKKINIDFSTVFNNLTAKQALHLSGGHKNDEDIMAALFTSANKEQ